MSNLINSLVDELSQNDDIVEAFIQAEDIDDLKRLIHRILKEAEPTLKQSSFRVVESFDDGPLAISGAMKEDLARDSDNWDSNFMTRKRD